MTSHSDFEFTLVMRIATFFGACLVGLILYAYHNDQSHQDYRLAQLEKAMESKKN